MIRRMPNRSSPGFSLRVPRRRSLRLLMPMLAVAALAVAIHGPSFAASDAGADGRSMCPYTTDVSATLGDRFGTSEDGTSWTEKHSGTHVLWWDDRDRRWDASFTAYGQRYGEWYPVVDHNWGKQMTVRIPCDTRLFAYQKSRVYEDGVDYAVRHRWHYVQLPD